jgi:two-component system, chemotaxis family, protein-glutamate methylesterase/glutaminase
VSAGPAYTGTPIGGSTLLAVAIGASAGGPSAIETVLRDLPWNFRAPIAVCQHMTEGATNLWAQRLNQACHVRVVEAQQGESFLPGRAYIAPIGRHMRIRGTIDDPHISLEPDRLDLPHVPSIDVLMESIAKLYGSRGMGVLLTGMGSDGAEGLLAIRRAGGVTLAQPTETAFMSSMPAAAAEAGAVGEFVQLDKMSRALMDRVAGKL